MLLTNYSRVFEWAGAVTESDLNQWRSQELANTAWAFARLALLDGPFMQSLSSAFLSRVSLPLSNSAVNPEMRHVEMMLWALSRLDDLSLTWNFLQTAIENGWAVGSFSLAGPLAECEHRGLTAAEGRLLQLLALCPELCMPALFGIVLRLAEDGRAVVDDIFASSDDRTVDHLIKLIYPPAMEVCGASLASAYINQFGGHGKPHEKEARLLAHVLATAPAGNPVAICQAIEEFGRVNLSRRYGGSGGWAPSAGQWLKVAGDEKANVLAMAARMAPSGAQFLEIGTYCGYSSLRLAVACPGIRILTLEADPGNAVIARTIVAYAGLSHLVDVRIGHSEDLLPRLCQDVGVMHRAAMDRKRVSFSLVFFDQRGSRYSADLSMLEQLDVLAPGAVVVADNVLKPGAPVFLWHVLRSGMYETQVVTVGEYAMPGVEDWMSVSVLVHRVSEVPEVPEELRQLEWEADRMRSRAEQRPGVDFAAWTEFSTQMRHALAKIGIVAGSSQR